MRPLSLAPWLALASLLVLAACKDNPSSTGSPGSSSSPKKSLCGYATNDWCPPPTAGDPCGKHKDKETCKADPKCTGMTYRGESAVACTPGADGFSTNCPTVGCQSK